MNSLLPILLADQGDVRVYEVRGELCMSAEDLGRCLGYSDPQNAMNKIYQRNKEELDEYRFAYKIPDSEGEDADVFSVQTVPKNIPNERRGRSSIFYSEMGVYTVAMLANTETAKTFRRRIAALLKSIRLQQRLEMAEKYIALVEKHRKKPPLSHAEREKIRELDAQGVQICEIAARMGRSKAGISNFLRFGNTSGRIKTL